MKQKGYACCVIPIYIKGFLTEIYIKKYGNNINSKKRQTYEQFRKISYLLHMPAKPNE
jgi:hypothetical protein